MADLVLKPKRDRAVRNRHPWIFSGAVAAAPDAPEGQVVRVRAADGAALGYGHWIPGRDICCRMLHFGAEALTLGAEFWRGRFARAWVHRQQFVQPQVGEAFRLINAEGDHLPGLIVDVYGYRTAGLAVVQARTAGMRALLPLLAEFVQRELGVAHLLDQYEQPEKDGAQVRAGQWLLGGLERVEFAEDGLRFVAEVERGQKTGFFLDQRENRRLVGRLAQGRDVLNCFSYSGGFTAQALRGGARRAVSVDSSAHAIALAGEVMALNALEARHEAVAADCFDYLSAVAPGAFDLIVLDPPAFAKHVRTVDRAARGYKDINLRALRAIRRGGVLCTYSCSQPVSAELFRQVVFSAAADAGRAVRVLAATGHAPDHPVDLFHPEGEYLKGLVLVVD